MANKEEYADEIDDEFYNNETVAETLVRADVSIVGMRPLLMSSPKEMFAPKKRMTRARPGEDLDPMAEAEKRAYRDPANNELCVEANAILGMMYDSARRQQLIDDRGKKMKGSALNMVRSSLMVEPEYIPLLDPNGNQVKKYAAHAARAVNRATKGSVIRYRPLIADWRVDFQLKWNPLIAGLKESMVRNMIRDATYIGLLDWRPRFGIFRIRRFKVVSEAEPALSIEQVLRKDLEERTKLADKVVGAAEAIQKEKRHGGWPKGKPRKKVAGAAE